MMTLTYLRGDTITISVKRFPTSLRHLKYTFSPSGEVDDFIARKILRNPKYMGWFEGRPVPPPTFICEVCGFSGKSHLALQGHKRKHSPKIPHVKRLKQEAQSINQRKESVNE